MSDETNPGNADDLEAMSRLETLIDAYLQGDLAEADRGELSRTLLASPAARVLFWEMARLSAGLERWAGETWGERAANDEHGSAVRPAPSTELDPARPVTVRSTNTGWHRPIAASVVAAIIASGLVGASVAWAISLPGRSRSAVRVVLANPGFESGTTDMVIPQASATRLDHLPQTFGSWSTDRVRICTAENGVAPAEGSRMLSFEQALPGPGDPAVTTADSCDLYQIVDLAPYADLIARGGCSLRLTAKVCDASGPHAVQSLFVGRLSVFDRSVPDVLPGWTETRSLAASEAAERLLSSGEADRWQQVSATVSLPPRSRFAIVQIDATAMDRSSGRGAATFDRHYCDDVRLTLLLPEAIP